MFNRSLRILESKFTIPIQLLQCIKLLKDEIKICIVFINDNTAIVIKYGQVNLQ
jgi:ABC-type microcin C transport system duplicated ATPase subunit YejF